MAEDPVEASRPGTRDATRSYDSGRIRVLWDATLCIHTAICLKRLPQVFDVNARPWINLDGAEPQDVAATVRACPTGALRYDGPDVPPEVPDVPTKVEVRPNGPLLVRGDLTLNAPHREPRTQYRAALCRCGASGNKPFCDNSHRAIGFRDSSHP